jgi:hypothetical protein
MVVIERLLGQGVRIGPYVVRVLAIHAEEVVIALHRPDESCVACAEAEGSPRLCPVCLAESVVCPACAQSWPCPRCGSPLE